jgi:hypothetical protein
MATVSVEMPEQSTSAYFLRSHKQGKRREELDKDT